MDWFPLGIDADGLEGCVSGTACGRGEFRADGGRGFGEGESARCLAGIELWIHGREST